MHSSIPRWSVIILAEDVQRKPHRLPPGRQQQSLPLISSAKQPACAGLGLGYLLGNSNKLRSLRYGPNADAPYCYTAHAQNLPWQERALAHNKYLLDNCLPSCLGSSPCAYKRQASQYPAAPPKGLNKEDMVKWIVRHAYMARVNQLFEDGNHRTAVLSIYEKLADAGWLLTADPFSIYIAISNRKHQETSAVEANMYRRIARYSIWKPSVSYAERAAFAEGVKQIAAVNSLFEHAHSWLTSMRVPRGEKRKRWRSFRRSSGHRHAQYVSLYGTPNL